MVCILGPNCYCIYIPETNQTQVQLPMPPIFFRLNLLMLPSRPSAPSATLRISTSTRCRHQTPIPPQLQTLTPTPPSRNHSSRLPSSHPQLCRKPRITPTRTGSQPWAQSRVPRAMIPARNCSPRRSAHALRISLGAHSHSVELEFFMHDMIPHHLLRLAQ